MNRTSFELARTARELPDDMGVELTLSVRLHRNGSLSVEGPVGDKAFCRKLLDEAWGAINRTHPTIVTPACDVDSRAKGAYL